MTQFVSGKTKVNMIIGDPVSHSLTPAFHNAAYELLGIAANYTMVACRVVPSQLFDAIKGMRALGIHGLSVTTPHKQEIVPLLDSVDADAASIGAINTVFTKDGEKLVGTNTDWIGITNAIKEVREIAGANVLVVGAGGAARAAVFGLSKMGATVLVTNRSYEKAESIAMQYGVTAIPFDNRQTLSNLDVIVNCTSVGMGQSTESPIPSSMLAPERIVLETIYSPRETRLVIEAKAAGATVLFGTDMFFHQAIAQIEVHTGVKVDPSVMRGVFESVTAPGVGSSLTAPALRSLFHSRSE